MAKSIDQLNLDEAKELIKFTGIEDVENFKDEFGKRFMTVESAVTNDKVISAVTGKRLNEVAGKLHKVAKFLNPEISLNKFNEKTLEENILEIESMLTAKITELETKAKSGNDKKLNDLEKALEEKDKSLNAYKELAENEANEKLKIKQEFETGMKSYKINHQYEQYKSKLSWIDSPSEVQRIGFDTKISTSYKFDLDEKDQLKILDKDGKPIPSKIKGGAMADPLEVLDMELDVNNLKKKNNAQPQKQFIFTPTNDNPKPGRKLTTDYQKRVAQINK